MVREKPHFDSSDRLISVIPKWINFITETWSRHLGGIEIHIGRTEMLGFGLGSVFDQLGESGIENVSGTEMIL